MTGKRKLYNREFKVNAVRLVLEGGQTMKEVATGLGINYYTLAEWKKQYETKGGFAFPGSGKIVYATEVERENAELKKRLRRVEMERDILKKGTVVLSSWQLSPCNP